MDASRFPYPIARSGNKTPRRMGEVFLMVELSGVEPLTSCMPCKRSTS